MDQWADGHDIRDLQPTCSVKVEKGRVAVSCTVYWPGASPAAGTTMDSGPAKPAELQGPFSIVCTAASAGGVTSLQ